MSKSHGEIIARVPNPESREAFARQVIFGHGNGTTPNVVSVREAKSLAESHTQELSKAGFDTKSGTLLNDVGPCTTCPFKSGNNRLDYPTGRADICNNVPCFMRKTEAGRELKLVQLTKSKNAVPLSAGEMKKLMPYGYMDGNSSYVELTDTCYQDKRYRNYRTLLGKELGKTVTLYVGVKARDGSIAELARRTEVNAVLKRVHRIDLAGRRGGGKEQAQQRLISQARALAAHKALARVATYFEKIVAGAFAVKLDKTLRIATLSMLNAVSNDGLRDVAKRRGLEIKGQYPRFANELAKTADAMKGAELFGLIMEAGVAESLQYWKGAYGGTVRDHSLHVLKVAGVDLSALQAIELAAIKEKRADRDRKAKAKAKKQQGKAARVPKPRAGAQN